MSRLIVKPSLKLFAKIVLLAIRALSKRHVVTVSDIIKCIPAETVRLASEKDLKEEKENEL